MRPTAIQFQAVFVGLCLACLAAAHDAPQETAEEENVEISGICAAVLLTSSTVTSAGAALIVTPAMLAAAGFGTAGVTGGSFAAWWQSTMPLIAKGILFSHLQSAATGGVGTFTAMGGGFAGGAAGAQYLKSFCPYVDDANPDSPMGQIFAANLVAVRRAGGVARAASDTCASSPTCAAAAAASAQAASDAASVVSSLWGRVSAAASDTAATMATEARAAKLEFEIKLLSRSIDNQKGLFGSLTFDHMRHIDAQFTEEAWGGREHSMPCERLHAQWSEGAVVLRILADSTSIIEDLESQIDQKKGELWELQQGEGTRK